MNSRRELLESVKARKDAASGAPSRVGAASKAGAGKGLFARLADLYARMENAYAACAAKAGLHCRDCPRNCCVSFFQHHTHMEWAYLWRGLQALPDKRRKELLARARAWTEKARQDLAGGRVPAIMCPLNENGLCALYAHRLMICRLHGTRNLLRLPDGRERVFPGCDRFQALHPDGDTPAASSLPPSAPGGPPVPEAPAAGIPTLDRTEFYRELADLERELLERAGRPLPRVDLTLAEMMVLGPPKYL